MLSAAMLAELANNGGPMGPSPSEFAALNQKLRNSRRRVFKKTGIAAEASAAVDASGHPVVVTPPGPR